MAAPDNASQPRVDFAREPSSYQHWKLQIPERFEGRVAELVLDIPEDGGLRPGYPLKLNSYDLGVDLELADALTRIRFEHPKVAVVVFKSAKDRIFCSGANIYMLSQSTHAFKVNFCKFTNETRLTLEEMSEHSAIRSLAALNGTASGGGYELAIACDQIVLQEDGSSAVSYPETPLLGVLPGTGGLTRLVDKRKIRRDLADAFSTLAEGVRGRRALEWGLIDEAPPRAKFEAAVDARIRQLLDLPPLAPPHPGMTWTALEKSITDDAIDYKYVHLAFDRKGRTATLTVRGPGASPWRSEVPVCDSAHGPDEGEPTNAAELAQRGAEAWIVRAFRELDDALLELRFNEPSIGVVAVRTEGDPKRVLAVDQMLHLHAAEGLTREVRLHVRRVLKRMDMTAKSFFAVIEPGGAWAGTLLELALASDRVYMRDDDEGANAVYASSMNAGAYPMGNGLSRLHSRFLADPSKADAVIAETSAIDTQKAQKLGLVTFAPDDLDWDDELRIAFEERASLSPDALTGMEQNLRFGGPETLETKIFARLSAWQNWIFQRPNAVGEKGALTLYGKPDRPEFSYLRT